MCFAIEQDYNDSACSLKKILNDFLELLLHHEIDLDMFSTLNEEDLKMIGVVSLGARRKMLSIIQGSFPTFVFIMESVLTL